MLIYRKEIIEIQEKISHIVDTEQHVYVEIYYIYLFGKKVGYVEKLVRTKC